MHFEEPWNPAIAGTAASRASCPIWECVKVRTYENGVLFLSTDLEVWFEYFQDAVVPFDEVGQTFAVHKNAFKVNPAKKRPVEWVFEDGTLSVTQDGVTQEFATLPADEFPALPEAGERQTIELPASAVYQVAPAMSSDETRKLMMGALLDCSEESVAVVATDTYRQHLVTLPPQEARFTGIFTRYAVDVLKRAKVEPNEVLDVHLGEHITTLESERGTIHARMNDGVPWNWRKVRCDEDFYKPIAVMGEPVATALKKLKPIAQENDERVFFSFNGSLTVSTGGDERGVGTAKKAYATPACEVLQDFESAYNRTHVLDVLEAAGEVTLYAEPEKYSTPARFDAGNFSAVLMPMRKD